MQSLAATFLVVSLAAAFSAAAQDYPARPVRVIAPFAPGGATDVLARLVGQRLGERWRQQVIVDNRPGAGGNIGTELAVRAAPDGYTISFGHLGTHVANGAIYSLPYDLLADLDPVVLLPSNPMVVVSKPTLPAKTLKEVLAWLKTNQATATAGTAGAGSGSHIAGVYLESLTGLKLQYVPYRGTAPALNDLVGGQIDIIVDQASNSMQQIRAGRIRAYAISDNKRLAAAPEIPTAEEAGLPGFHMTLWNGLWVPKGTPKDIVARLNAAVVEAMADPAVQKRLTDLGLELPARDQQTPQALAAWHKAEVDKWWPIIKKAGIKPE